MGDGVKRGMPYPALRKAKPPPPPITTLGSENRQGIAGIALSAGPDAKLNANSSCASKSGPSASTTWPCATVGGDCRHATGERVRSPSRGEARTTRGVHVRSPTGSVAAFNVSAVVSYKNISGVMAALDAKPASEFILSTTSVPAVGGEAWRRAGANCMQAGALILRIIGARATATPAA